MDEPPRSAAERLVGELHGAEATALLAGSGAAAGGALTALTNPGGHVIVPAQLAGPVRDFVENDLARMGREVSFTDCTDIAAVGACLRPETQVVLTESLSDPLMRPSPVNELAELAHAADLFLVVDNTALSPALLRPLDLGATLVVERCSPYLDGRVGLDASVVAGPPRLVRRVAAQAARTGARLDPWSSELLAASLRALALRMSALQRNTREVAAFLRGHPGVARVNLPDFDSAPWAAETHRGFGGLLSFEPRAPLVPATHDESVSLPARTSHAGLGARRRRAAGISATLVRVAPGIEPPARLVGTLRGLLDAARPAPPRVPEGTRHV